MKHLRFLTLSAENTLFEDVASMLDLTELEYLEELSMNLNDNELTNLRFLSTIPKTLEFLELNLG